MSILLIISILSPLFPLLYGWKNRLSSLWNYSLVGLFIDVTTSFIRLSTHANIQWAGNLFIGLELIFIAWYYRQHVFAHIRLYWLLIVVVEGAFFIATINSSFFEFNTVGASSFCLLYIVFGLYGYVSLINHKKYLYIGKSHLFWCNTGIFVYASSTCLIFLFRYIIQEKDPEFFGNLWRIFYLIINIQRYVLIGVGLRKHINP